MSIETWLMALNSKIAPCDSRWRALFSAEKDRIAPSFAVEFDEIHHVGSTAVPGLAAKPEIDLLVEVSEHGNESACDDPIRALGYVRGKPPFIDALMGPEPLPRES